MSGWPIEIGGEGVVSDAAAAAARAAAAAAEGGPAAAEPAPADAAGAAPKGTEETPAADGSASANDGSWCRDLLAPFGVLAFGVFAFGVFDLGVLPLRVLSASPAAVPAPTLIGASFDGVERAPKADAEADAEAGFPAAGTADLAALALLARVESPSSSLPDPLLSSSLAASLSLLLLSLDSSSEESCEAGMDTTAAAGPRCCPSLRSK